MAKRGTEPKTAPQKPASSQEESSGPADEFVQRMLLAADFVKNCGGLEPAKKLLSDAGQFIQRAGSVQNATEALGVLEQLKEKIA